MLFFLGSVLPAFVYLRQYYSINDGNFWMAAQRVGRHTSRSLT